MSKLLDLMMSDHGMSHRCSLFSSHGSLAPADPYNDEYDVNDVQLRRVSIGWEHA